MHCRSPYKEQRIWFNAVHNVKAMRMSANALQSQWSWYKRKWLNPCTQMMGWLILYTSNMGIIGCCDYRLIKLLDHRCCHEYCPLHSGHSYFGFTAQQSLGMWHGSWEQKFLICSKYWLLSHWEMQPKWNRWPQRNTTSSWKRPPSSSRQIPQGWSSLMVVSNKRMSAGRVPFAHRKRKQEFHNSEYW